MQDDKRQMGSFRCVVVAVTGSVAKAADCARHAAIRCVLGNDSRSDFSIDVVIRRFVLMRIPMSRAALSRTIAVGRTIRIASAADRPSPPSMPARGISTPVFGDR